MKHLSSWRHESGNARLYISLLWLAPLVLNSLHPPARSAQARSCRSRGVWRSKTSVCTPEEHFPKLSPFSAPPGIGGELQKSVSVQACRGAGDGMGGWDLWWEFSSETLKIWNREKNRKEKEREREREDFLTLELNSETVALRRNLIRGPEDNVSVLKKPGYCWKDV